MNVPTATPKRADTKKARLLSLDDLDKRTAAARYAFDLRDSVIADLGGEGSLSAIKLEMASSLAVMSAMISDASARFLRGEQIDPGSVATLVNSRNRTAQLLGMDRVMKDANDLDAYIAGRA
ncbi:hypothetical protein NA8A_05598 [Nitratireductor indicus C115]|uniref:Uncharacterized protein n=2 Tax=Nitratireductor indicus TaxID=721133 RepID=K2P8C3_9HYPH|nr:hypothetical protein NA8A_05598 [Nitratireductor indicus C115]